MPKDGRAIAETVRQVMLPLWNAYYFFVLYANTDGIEARYRTDAEGELDRYILAKTEGLVGGVGDALNAMDVPRACTTVLSFIETLNNWSIRRSRARFWSPGSSRDKQDAFDTLYTVLVTTARTLAPLLPFLTEKLHAVLCADASVHLEGWPDVDRFPDDMTLV